MKIKAILVTAAAAALLLTGCGESVEENSSASEQESSVQSVAVTDIAVKELADAALHSVEFPEMIEVTDEIMLENVMDFSGYEQGDYFVYQQAMSVHLCEIIVIRTQDTAAGTEALEKRRKQLCDQLAFYPEQMASAEAAVVGSKNDICYLIAHEQADTAEKALRAML